ncbi:hypothetical protein [Novosphingobium sp. JCM 18896]|uniref:hypothetical protein n=1 Tax=Novosphingobium sp. JCM 18896 TaxID=2989731 RepID=UPI0022224CDE|nr:hypothetical protein [Novosphingobium sp. JCM 18896]MCW1430313.1 hypothetical protein [Novosphingobium sp. JCM 18896]
MPRRILLSTVSLAALALAPLPAFARDDASRDVTGDVAKQLSDPGNQVAATVALTALSEALLDVRIEPLRRALGAMGSDMADDLPPDARLRDLAGPGARDLPGDIGRTVPKTMGAAAGMAGAVGEMLPELQAAIDRMKNALPKP